MCAEERKSALFGEGLDAERLLAYLREHVPDVEGPLEVEQFPAGFSNLTYLVRAGGRYAALVARDAVLATAPLETDGDGAVTRPATTAAS